MVSTLLSWFQLCRHCNLIEHLADHWIHPSWKDFKVKIMSRTNHICFLKSFCLLTRMSLIFATFLAPWADLIWPTFCRIKMEPQQWPVCYAWTNSPESGTEEMCLNPSMIRALIVGWWSPVASLYTYRRCCMKEDCDCFQPFHSCPSFLSADIICLVLNVRTLRPIYMIVLSKSPDPLDWTQHFSTIGLTPYLPAEVSTFMVALLCSKLLLSC